MRKRFTEEQIIRTLKAHEGGRSALEICCEAGIFRGYPKEILSDNGSEFTSNAMNTWAYEKQIVQTFIDPGKPVQNASIDFFNGKLRDEGLNQYLSKNIEVARGIIENWRIEYNQSRPHSSLGYLTPSEYAVSLV